MFIKASFTLYTTKLSTVCVTGGFNCNILVCCMDPLLIFCEIFTIVWNCRQV
jgi:hypothetical protein